MDFCLIKWMLLILLPYYLFKFHTNYINFTLAEFFKKDNEMSKILKIQSRWLDSNPQLVQHISEAFH
jgi:hypothetical protein